MPNSLKSMIKKLAHKGCISSVECDELLTKLNGHDDKIRADERRKFAEWLAKSDYANGYFDTENGFVSVDKVLAEYEKEKKNEM